MNGIDALNGFYRDVIGPTVEGLYNNFNPLIAKVIERTGKGQISREGEDPVFGEGGYYQGMSDARLRPGETGRSYSTDVARGLIKPEQQTMRWEITTELLVLDEAEQGEEISNYLMQMGMRWIKGWNDSHSIDLYGDGTGTLATIDSVSTDTVTITDNQVIRKLPKNMYVHIGDEADFVAGNAGSIYLRKVEAQLGVNTFTIDDPTSIASAQQIRREVRRDGGVPTAANNVRTFQGLESNLATTGTLFNIDRTLFEYSPYEKNIVAATGIAFDDVVDMIDDTDDLGIDMQDLFLPKAQFSFLAKGLVDDIITNTKSEAFLDGQRNIRQGVRSISYDFGGKIIDVFSDSLLKSDKGYGLDPSTWRSYVGKNGILMYGNGRPKVVNFGEDVTGEGLVYNPADPHSHAIEAVFYGQYACIDPKRNMVINFT
jgi:hypothetical protein